MKVIFQDVDGPLIPLGTHYSRMFDKEKLSFIYDPNAVNFLNMLCEEHDAVIVFNSAHNINGAESMAHQAAYNGIKYLHPTNWITKYPHMDLRLDAIFDWLGDNPDVTEWIVFDDWDVSKNKQVKVLSGIKEEHYLLAKALLADPEEEEIEGSGTD